jgi:hypothetical protein
MSASAKARLVVLPIATLGEVLAHGFGVHVWCPRCHQFRQPTIPAERLSHRFAGTLPLPLRRSRLSVLSARSPRSEETERHDH